MKIYKVRFDCCCVTAVAKDITSLYDMMLEEIGMSDIMSCNGTDIFFAWSNTYTETAWIEEIDITVERIIQSERH